MEIFEFAAIVVSVDIVIFGILAVRGSIWVDRWIREKEEEYLYGYRYKKKHKRY